MTIGVEHEWVAGGVLLGRLTRCKDRHRARRTCSAEGPRLQQYNPRVEFPRAGQVGTNIVRRALHRIIERSVSGLEAEDKANGDAVTVTTSG